MPLVGEGERGLDEAPPERDLEPLPLGDEDVLHQLLGYGGPALLHLPGPQVRPGGPRDPLEVHPEVVVEAPVLDGDDRAREVLAEVFEADGLAALFHLELADPVPVHVVDVGVLCKLGVALVEAIPVLPDHEQVKTDDQRSGQHHRDQAQVEEDPQRSEEEAEPALFRRFLARFEEAVHDLPRTSLPQPPPSYLATCSRC
jgi:hypothetical protein